MNEPDHLRIEMDVLEDNCSTRHMSSFLEGRPSTSSQRSNVEDEGNQVVGSIRNILEKVEKSAHDVNVVGGANDLPIYPSPVISTSGQCSVQEESTQLCNSEITQTQSEDSNDCKTQEGYFLKRRDMQFKYNSRQNPKQMHSIPAESTQTIDSNDLDTRISNGRNKHRVETAEIDNYFLANSELELECLPGANGRQITTKPDTSQTLASSSTSKLNRETKRTEIIKREQHTGPYGDYRRRMLPNNGYFISDESLLSELALHEAKQQWSYRPRMIRPRNLRSRPNIIDIEFIRPALIVIIIVITLNILMWIFIIIKFIFY